MAKITKRMKILTITSVILILSSMISSQNINVNQNDLHEEDNPKPSPAWYIEILANGDVYPADGRIIRVSENKYIFAPETIKAYIIIRRSNVELDGMGNRLIPVSPESYSRGIEVSANLHHVTIKNIFFDGYDQKHGWVEPISVFDYSQHIYITGNTMTLYNPGPHNPVGVWARNVQNMEIYENTINGPPEAKNIVLKYSYYNKIYHNNFHCPSIFDDRTAYNKWYDTVSEEGNYWADYTGTDNDGDGIGDTLLPYLGVDYYPFMDPDGWIYNAPPIADAGVTYEGTEGATVTFDASGSYDPEGDPLQYRWDFDNNLVWDTDWGSSPIAYNTWNDDYTGTIVLEVSDGKTSVTDTATVTIYNVDPSTDIGLDIIVDKKEPIFFSPTIIDPGDDSFTYSWDFESDDITDSDLESPIHAYSEPGIYTVSLEVFDDDGGVGTDTCVITVSDTLFHILIDDTDPTMDWDYFESNYAWCSGSGEVGDPYILENLDIDGGGTFNCIEIRNSNSHFIIQNCHLYNSKDDNLHGGIFMQNVNNGIIKNNNCSNNGRSGIWIENCDEITIVENTFIDNGGSGICLRSSHLNNISLNTIDNCHNAIIEVTSTRNIISRNTINNSWIGVYLSGGNHNNVADNEIYNCDYSGIYFYSSNNNITGNTLLYNNRGIFAQHSNTNNVSGNTICYSINEGIYFMYCDEGIILGNNISNNKIGIWLSDHCDKNNFSGNIINENDNYGIFIEDVFTDSDENFFSKNLFSNNGINAFDGGTGTNNQWDNGVIGNYWDDYTGVDVDGDGIGDTPYIIPGTALGQDNFPIMEIDNNPPTTEIIFDKTVGPDGWFITDVGVTLSATDDFSGVEETKYRIDGGSWLTYVTPFTISKEGDTLIEFYSIDNFGNTECEKSSEFKIVKAPKVEAGADQTVNEGALVLFDASYTDLGDTSLHTISWDFGDGDSATEILNPTHEYEENGLFTVTLTVEDGFGGIGTDSLTITVNNVAPTLSELLATSIDEGGTSTLSGIIIDPGILDTFTLTVDWGDSPSIETFDYLAGTTTFSLTHQYFDDDIYTITLSVEDDDGGISGAILTVTVNNVAPTLTISGDPDVNEGSLYTLSLNAIDPGTDTISEWEINWGDGNIETIPGNPSSVTHIYADGPNTHTISATATDEDGTYNTGWPNMGFETGGFTDWTVYIPPGGSATVEFSHNGNMGTLYEPVCGTYLALLKTDGPNSYTTIERTFDLLAGQTISGWAAFDARGPTFWNDKAMVRVLNTLDQVIDTPWYVDISMIGHEGDGPWTQWTWTAPADGIYILEYRVATGGFNVLSSYAVFDGESLDQSVFVKNVAPTLSLSGLPEVDEGTPYTLDLSAPDPGDDTISEWKINWGDGNIEIISGNPSSVTHTYADGPNTQTISATATDEDGTYNTGWSNMGFETGGFTDWTVYVSPGGSATVSILHFGSQGTLYLPMVGTNLARLRAAGPFSYTSVERTFDLLAGQTISGWAAFDARGSFGSTDYAKVRILDNTDTVIATPWFANIASVGDNADGPWTEWSWTAPADGVYTLEYRVTNGFWNPANSYALFDMETSKSISVTVNNVAPTLSLSGPPEVDEGSFSTLSGTITDPSPLDSFTLTVNWGDGSPIDTFNYPAGTTSFSEKHQYFDDDIYIITLSVEDDDGGTDDDTLTITVNNVAPSVDAGPDYTIDEGLSISFSGSFTDPGADTHEYQWDFGDETFISGTLTPTHTYKDNGIYLVTLTVTDDDGGVGIDTLIVTVNNVAPTIEHVDPREVEEDKLDTYYWEFTDPGILDWHEYTIVWADGTESTGEILAGVYSVSVDHEYMNPGNYIVTMTLKDKDGGECILSFEVEVLDKTPPETTFELVGTMGNNGWYVSDVTVTLTAIDDYSDIYSICYSYGTVNIEELDENPLSFVVSDEGTIIISYYSIDTAGNIEVTKSITLYIDKTAPTSTLIPQQPYILEDLLYYVSTATVFILSAEDAEMGFGSGVDLLQYRLDDDVDWIEYEGSERTFTVTEIGPHTIYYRSIDVASNEEEIKSIQILVNASELTYEGGIEGTYSDPVSLEAILTDIATGDPIPGMTIVFTIGDQTVSAVTLSNGSAYATLILDQIPGDYYIISASFVNDGEYLASSDESTFTINKEYAYAEYTGDMVVPLNAETITLRATVFDEDDGNWGDLTKIHITFTIYSEDYTLLKTYSLWVIFTNVEGVGIATLEIPNLFEGGYLVKISFDPNTNEYYQGSDTLLTTIIVYEPTGDFVTGGGWIEDANGNKGNFGFNIKYKKNGLPKGQAIYVYREGEYVFIVKANAWVGMAIISDDNYAIFEAKCNIKQIHAESGEIVWEEGNYRLIIEVWDNSEDGKEDVFQLRVYDKIGLLYYETGFDPYGFLGGGNIVIHIDKKK